MIDQDTYLKDALKKEFISRAKRNPKYSLRAFAKSIAVDQSLLSKILSGKMSISKKMESHLMSILAIDPFLVMKDKSRGMQVEEDIFDFISDWTHFAILELIKIKNTKSTHSWIAKRLGVNKKIVDYSIARLVKLRLIEKRKGKYISLDRDLTWDKFNSTSLARKNLQKTFLRKAIERVDQTPISLRENSSLTIAINKNKISELKELIVKFRNSVDELCESHKDRDEVYQLCVALFPLSEEVKNV